MRDLDEIKYVLRRELPYLSEHYHVDQLGVCGSYVRGEQTPESDLDVLITFSKTPDLFTFIEIKHYLEDLLELEIDLGMPEALKEGPAAENIRREVEYL